MVVVVVVAVVVVVGLEINYLCGHSLRSAKACVRISADHGLSRVQKARSWLSLVEKVSQIVH